MSTTANCPVNHDTEKHEIQFNYDHMDFKYVAPESTPSPLFFRYYDLSEKSKSSFPDVSKMMAAFLIISRRFKALLEEFDIGDTHIYPVTVHEYDRMTPRPEEHYVPNITAQRDGFVPEQSEDAEAGYLGRWRVASTDTRVAVRPDAGGGLDLWADWNVYKMFFLSDRLVRAAKAEEITGPSPKRCLVV